MTGWTPGPWLIHAERRWVVPAGDAFKEPAKALPVCQLRDPDERLTEDETLANGFLISAAPELYEALSKLLAGCASRRVGGGDGDTFVVSAPPAEALREAAAALAKARGES